MANETVAASAEARAAGLADIHPLQSMRPSTDANVFIQLLVGILGTILVCVAVIPFKGTKLNYLYGIINARGPVQWVELFMSFMVAAMIILKGNIVKNQLKVIASNPIPRDLDLNDDKQLHEFRKNLAQREEFSWSILLNRIDRAIALWLGSKDIGRVSTWAQAESGRDVSASDSSFALSRVLMWAIPILGFIGTVQGLGMAVGGFGVMGGSADISQIKSAIGKVTIGLSVAFDTTLLALLLTTILMFPLTFFQRIEEGLFVALDNYLDDVLLSRLPSPEQQPIIIESLEDSIEAAFRRYIPDPDRYDEVFTRSIDKAATVVEERFADLAKTYEATLRNQTERLVTNLNAVGGSIEYTLRAVVNDVRKQEESMLANRKQVGEDEADRFKGLLENVHVTAGRLAEEYRKSADGIRQSTQEGAQMSLDAAKDLANRMDSIARMAAGIQDLLHLEQAVQKSIAGLSVSADFQKTLAELRQHLDVTNAFCMRLSKPRVITLREEMS